MKNQKDIEALSQRIIKEVEILPENCVGIFKTVLLADKASSITYNEYLSQLQKKLKICTCQASFNSKQLIVHCLDCQKNKNSCICVNCFLKGKHQGHKVYINLSPSATCDCGDPLFWSQSGFCSDHPGPEPHPELTQLEENTRIKLISVSRAAFSKYLKYATEDPQLFIEITDFLLNLVSIGDATRRCVCLAMQDSFSFYDLYVNCYNLKQNEMNKLLKFLGSLTNDEVFRYYFSISFLNNLPKIISFNNSYAISNEESKTINKLFSFTFHAASAPEISELIKKDLSFNCQDAFKKSFNLLLDFIFNNMVTKYHSKFQTSDTQNRLLNVISAILTVYDCKNPIILDFVNEIASVIAKKEFSFPLIRIFGDKINDPNKVQNCLFHVYYNMFYMFSKFDSKKVFTEKPLHLLNEFFNSQLFQSIDEHYKCIGEFDRDIWYHSVLSRDVQFAQSYLLHIMAFNCLNLKEKSLFDYVNSITDDSEKFLRNWAVIPLRWLAVSALDDFSLFIRNSRETNIAMNSFKYCRNIKIKFVPTFALLQTILKTTKDVDSFLLMIISTYGLFELINNDAKIENEKLDDKQQRLLLLSILHIVLCLIFDTLCAEKNIFAIRRLIVISKLMDGDMTLEEIQSAWYKKILNDDNFIDDLSSFASRVSTKNGSKFHLTDNSEWHPLLPYMNITLIIPLIQKFIDKNPDSLINFPKLPNDSVHILFSPILWALEYFVLSHQSCKDYQIIHQFVFNTLIITSQNSNQYYQNENKEEENDDDDYSVLQVQDFIDLTQKLKNLKFNQLLKKKICFVNKSNEQKSMIDLISVFGNVGITVLTRLNVSKVSPNENQHVKEELKKKNHERAKMLKMQIMSNFSKQQKAFQSPSTQVEDNGNNNNNDDDDDDTQNMECSICHLNNEDDCFSYPALIFKSSLSSYFKWRFSKAKLVNLDDDSNNNETGVIDDFTNVPGSFDSFNSVRICMHPIHASCIQRDEYNCPSDRCPRNASIPIIAGIYDNESTLNETVLSQAHKFIKKAYYNSLKYAVFSFASQIEVLEMRHRSNPGCLDDATNQFTLKNIYLCIWHVLRKYTEKWLIDAENHRRQKLLKNEGDEEEEEEYESYRDDNENIINVKKIYFTPLMKYILYSLLLNEKPTKCNKIDLNDFIKGNILHFLNDPEIKRDTDNHDLTIDTNIVKYLNGDYQMLQFLRCVAIFDHFALDNKITQDNNSNNNNNEFIDWDLILSSSNLCKHYNISYSFTKSGGKSGNDLSLPMFSLINLPQNFLDFIHPPYSAPILDYGRYEAAICLLTGKTVLVKSLDQSYKTDYKPIGNFLKRQFNSAFSLFLKLNGDESSQVIVSSLQLKRRVSLWPFYTDKFGDKDTGMKRGALLYLNNSRIDDIIDNFLAGTWTNLITFNH